MLNSNKSRKGPLFSATKYSLYTQKRGNDGNMWKIVKNKNGTKRWLKVTKKVSKRSNAIKKDPESVWGKNKSLEKFWEKLASRKRAVLIYTNGAHKIVALPDNKKTYFSKFDEFDNNPEIKAVLISNQSSDSYELLYRKAKNKSINDVIKSYKTYFKSSGRIPSDLIKQGFPLMKKVLYPY